jgi:hypothetical protein
VTWLLERVLDLIERVAGGFYGHKYGTLARQFGRGPAADDRRRGLIILQIDGLSHRTLRAALEQGAMPHLARLLDRDGYRLERWWCGVPSSTPAVQGGIMYGNNWNVPAFRWYEKDSGHTMVAKRPHDARILQDRLSQGRPGLMEEGSSYVNIYDGGARVSLFTISALGGQRFFENVRGVGFAMLLVLSPLRLLRLIATVGGDFLRDLWQRLVGRIDTRLGPRRRVFSPLEALLQIIASVVFRELQTFGVLLDIYRRLPSIYANYYGYDEIAHQLGPLNDETLRALRGIDSRIREIDRTRRRFAARRGYDLFVLSDHGMSPCTPFKERFGQSLGAYLAGLVEGAHGPVVVDETHDEEWRGSDEARLLLAELDAIAASLSPRSRRLAAVIRNFAARRVPADVLADDGSTWDLSRHRDLVMRSSGTIAHVYFNVTPAQMDLSQIELVYPDLLRHLVEHPGLGLVLGREQGEAMAMTLRGPRRLQNPADPLIRDLLDKLPDAAPAAEQLARLVSFPASGDLVLFGSWDGLGQTVGFEEHWATHGGIGGEQNWPFMLVPPDVTWDVGAITDPRALYPLFMGRYGRGAPVQDGAVNDRGDQDAIMPSDGVSAACQ